MTILISVSCANLLVAEMRNVIDCAWGVTRNIQAPYLLGHVQRDFFVTFISILWFHESHGHDRNCIAMGVTGVRMGCALPWNRCGSWAGSPLCTSVLESACSCRCLLGTVVTWV